MNREYLFFVRFQARLETFAVPAQKVPLVESERSYKISLGYSNGPRAKQSRINQVYSKAFYLVELESQKSFSYELIVACSLSHGSP